MRPCAPVIGFLLSSAIACASAPDGGATGGESAQDADGPQGSEGPPDGTDDAGGARVEGVEVTGSAGEYTFSVTVSSPDTGCDRYADWWEVIRPDGSLVYRRILAHSHVDEQPFARGGSPVAVESHDEVIVRVHMNPDGYGDRGQRGSVADGFQPASVGAIAPELASAPPQPETCQF